MQNFGKFFGANTVDADIPNRTEICGVNESGKTTIKRAVQYVLNCGMITARKSQESGRMMNPEMIILESRQRVQLRLS